MFSGAIQKIKVARFLWTMVYINQHLTCYTLVHINLKYPFCDNR